MSKNAKLTKARLAALLGERNVPAYDNKKLKKLLKQILQQPNVREYIQQVIRGMYV